MSFFITFWVFLYLLKGTNKCVHGCMESNMLGAISHPVLSKINFFVLCQRHRDVIVVSDSASHAVCVRVCQAVWTLMLENEENPSLWVRDSCCVWPELCWPRPRWDLTCVIAPNLCAATLCNMLHRVQPVACRSLWLLLLVPLTLVNIGLLSCFAAAHVTVPVLLMWSSSRKSFNLQLWYSCRTKKLSLQIKCKCIYWVLVKKGIK